MNRFIKHTIFFLGLLFATPLSSQIIYETNNKYAADYVIYITDNRWEADWTIFITESYWDAQAKRGWWLLSDHFLSSEYRIYITNNKYEADRLVSAFAFIPCLRYHFAN